MVNVVFRVDASYRIGAGHAVRCLALANVLGGLGSKIWFVCRHLPDTLAAKVRSGGHEIFMLPPALTGLDDIDRGTHADWLGTSAKEDARQTKEAIRGLRRPWLIVDHYALDCRWENAIREIASGIMVIDDLADQAHDCDLLLDQNYYSDSLARYHQLVPSDATCLFGPQYALLHPQFSATRARSGSAQSDRLFVSVGSNDPFRIGIKVVQILRGRVSNHLGADIVMGTDAAAFLETSIAADGLSCVNVHGFSDKIADLMARCTAAIGAAGTSTWERCAMGLPSIVVITADNQRKMAADLAQIGAIMLLGDAARVSAEMLSGAVTDLMGNPALRSRMRLDIMNLVDGQGAYRVANRVLEVAQCTV